MSSKDSHSSDPGVERAGSFRYLLAADQWEWSDAVARMHGYAPGEIVPSTEVIQSHEHPDDRPAVSHVVDHVLRHGGPCSSRHRIIDANGHEHLVIVVGDRLLGDDRQVLGTTGFYVDVTESFDADLQRSVTEVVEGVEERRAAIHQAVGILRMAYGISADRAFDLLVWRSQQTNTKLRTIAERFVDRLASAPPGPGDRSPVDHALITAHEWASTDRSRS